MAKHQDLCFQRGSRSEKSDQPAPDQPAEVAHRAEDSADSLPQANRFGFATGTRVKSRHDALKFRCPLYPRKRTFAHAIMMSALGQLRTHALQQNTPHSITSSARASSGNGTVRPTAFAVLRLIPPQLTCGPRISFKAASMCLQVSASSV